MKKPANALTPAREPTEKPLETKSVVLFSLLFIAILCILPFIIDFFAKLFLAIGAQQAAAFFKENLWLEGVLGYLPVYLLMLFYIKTTFNPLSMFGYQWNKQYLWLSVYLGLGSGVLIFLIDKANGLAMLNVQAFAPGLLLGYLLSWVVLPALTEETLFRGVIQGYYQGTLSKTFTKHKVSIAIFIASAFEIVFHLSMPMYYGVTHGGVMAALLRTLPQLIYVAVFGFIGGVVYQRTGSLAGPMIIHALGNLTELVLIWSFT